jgi:hypothetical protein
MSLPVRILWACLLAPATAAAGAVVPDDFFLVQRLVNDSRTAFDIALSRTGLTAQGHADGILEGAPSVAYSGKLFKPYHADRAFSERHRLFIAVPIGDSPLTAGIGGDVAFDVRNRKTEEAVEGWIGERSGRAFLYSKYRLGDVNHTKNAYGCRVNVLWDGGWGMVSLALTGGIAYHAGYSLGLDRVNGVHTKMLIHEYEPSDLSGRWSVGLMRTRRISFLGKPAALCSGARYERSTERLPLRAPAGLPSKVSDDIEFDVTYRGTREENRFFRVWTGVLPASPSSTARRHLPHTGRYLYGFRFSRVVVGYTYSTDESMRHERTYRPGQPAEAPRSSIRVEHRRSIIAAGDPELFLIEPVSISLPMELEFAYRGEPHPVPDLLYGRVSARLGMRLPVGSNGRIEAVLSTGELEMNAPIPLRTLADLPARYRAYRATMAIRFIRMIGSCD